MASKRRGVRAARALRLPRSPRRRRAGRMARRHPAAPELDATRQSRSINGSVADSLNLASADDRAASEAVPKRWRRSRSPRVVPYRSWWSTAGVPDPTAGRGDNTAARWCAASKSCRRWPSGRRAAGARSHSQRALDADGAGGADRKRPRCRRPRHLHGRRPRAADGRCRGRDRNLLGPSDHDAPARQPRPQRRPPGARARARSTGTPRRWHFRRSATTASWMFELAVAAERRPSSNRPPRRASGSNRCCTSATKCSASSGV